MRAILIDPKLHRIIDIELAGDTDAANLADMRRLIGSRTLDHTLMSDAGDSIWCDGAVLSRGDPCWAFRLGPRDHVEQRTLFGGMCIVTGADPRSGNSRPPQIPIDIIANDCEWLGEIVPEVHWVEDTMTAPDGRVFSRFRAVVTYSRPK